MVDLHSFRGAGKVIPSWVAKQKRPIWFRIKRMPGRAWSFVRALLGPRLSKVDAAARLDACEICPQRIVRPYQSKGIIKERWFCKACECGNHRWAELRRKVRMLKAYCPLRRQPGPYPDDAMREYIVGKGYAEQHQLDDASGQVGGCRGCGS